MSRVSSSSRMWPPELVIVRLGPRRGLHTGRFRQPPNERFVGFSRVPPLDAPHRRVRFQRRRIDGDRLPPNQTRCGQPRQNPRENCLVGLHVDPPPRARQRRVIRRRLSQFQVQERPQTQRIGYPPRNPPLRRQTLAVRFNVQTGYRAPNATELAIDYTTVLGGQIIGNPDLQPEQATSSEVGLAYETARMWFDLALFRNDITNRIQAVGDTRNALVRIYQNRAESELVGLELQSNSVLARMGNATSVNLGINAAHHFRMRDLDAAARNRSTDRIIRVYETQGSCSWGCTTRRGWCRWSGPTTDRSGTTRRKTC